MITKGGKINITKRQFKKLFVGNNPYYHGVSKIDTFYKRLFKESLNTRYAIKSVEIVNPQNMKSSSQWMEMETIKFSVRATFTQKNGINSVNLLMNKITNTLYNDCKINNCDIIKDLNIGFVINTIEKITVMHLKCYMIKDSIHSPLISAI